MALRDLLVCLDQNEAALDRLRLAADLARRHGSRLTALYLRERSAEQLAERKAGEFGLVPVDELNRLDQRIEAAIDDASDPARAALESVGRMYGLEVEWRPVAAAGADVVAQH